MMRRKRRNHSPEFKAKVAIAALEGDKSLAELAQQFDMQDAGHDFRRLAAGKPRRMKPALPRSPSFIEKLK